MYDITLLTEHTYIHPKTYDWYMLQVLLEDELVLHALREKGFSVAKKDWADPDVDWRQTRCSLFRTTWDYFERFSEFSKWLNETASKTTFLNSEKTIRWNIDKHYLADLNARGVHTVETHFLETGESADLNQLMTTHAFSEAIIKPAVSGAARHTYRINSKNAADHNTLLNSLLKEEAMMIQPFQKNIINEGELSLIVIGGKYTHAIRKIAKSGDFRVQDDHGGVVLAHIPSKEEIAFAEQAVAACDPQPIYARVDMIRDNTNKLAIMELELIEPELFFRYYKPAATILADEIYKRM